MTCVKKRDISGSLGHRVRAVTHRSRFPRTGLAPFQSSALSPTLWRSAVDPGALWCCWPARFAPVRRQSGAGTCVRQHALIAWKHYPAWPRLFFFSSSPDHLNLMLVWVFQKQVMFVPHAQNGAKNPPKKEKSSHRWALDSTVLSFWHQITDARARV